MSNPLKKYLFFFLVSTFAIIIFLTGTQDASAASCRSISNSAPWWGTDSRQNVPATNGAAVRISALGTTPDQNTCNGKRVSLQIFKDSSAVKIIDGTLKFDGNNRAGVPTFHIDWTVSGLGAGDHKVKFINIDNQATSSNFSGNLLQVAGANQICVFDGSPTVDPNQAVQNSNTNIALTVKVKSTSGNAASACNNWGISGVILDSRRGQVSSLGSHPVPNGSQQVVFTWNIGSNSPGSYTFRANMGSQSVESGQFFIGVASHKECRNNACVVVQGIGNDQCQSDTSCRAGDPAVNGPPITFELQNPLGIKTFQDLVRLVGRAIFDLAIPIAVILIIYAGFLMITSGAPGAAGNFKKGGQIIYYVSIGLAVIFIGRGFVTLIKSILDVRNGG